MEMTERLEKAINDYLYQVLKYETMRIFPADSIQNTTEELQRYKTGIALASLAKQASEQYLLAVVRDMAFPVTDELGDSV